MKGTWKARSEKRNRQSALGFGKMRTYVLTLPGISFLVVLTLIQSGSGNINGASPEVCIDTALYYKQQAKLNVDILEYQLMKKATE